MLRFKKPKIGARELENIKRVVLEELQKRDDLDPFESAAVLSLIRDVDHNEVIKKDQPLVRNPNYETENKEGTVKA